MNFENVNMIENFEKWKETLKRAINISKAVGMNDDFIVTAAKKIGDFLANNVDPENREQRLLKQLWDVGTEEEKLALAHLIIKMVQ